MPASACINLDSGCTKRSTRFKNVHTIYDEDYGRNPSTFKRIKTEIIDSELSVGIVSDKDSEQDCHDVSLKDLRTQCKAKNWKTSKITFEGCGIKNQAKTENDIDLDKPLITLKKKSPKTSLDRDNVKMDALRSSPCATKEEDTTSQRDKILSSSQTSLLKATMQGPVLGKLGRKIAELEQSKVVIDFTEIVGEQICCAEVNNTAGALASCAKPDVLCEIKTEDTNYSEFGTSICSIKNPEHSFFELQQKLMEGDDRVPQSCFMTRPAQLADVSDHSCEQTCSFNNFDDITAAKATEVVSSLGLTDEASNHQKTPENITNSDVDKSSTANGFMACSFNQSCHDRIDRDEHWKLFVHGNEPVKILEELSPIDESCADTQSDLCGSTEMNCTSLEGVVRMQADGQLDSIVCCGVRPKHMLLDMEIGHTATGLFTFDKTIDLAHPTSFVAQDGRLESIVYDVLNSHAQRTASKNKSSVGLPETAVIQSPLIDFTDNCFEDKRASDDNMLPPNNVDWPLKDKLNSTIDYDICRSINDGEGSEEELVLQHQLYQSCSDKFNFSGVMPEISNAEESQKLSAGARNSSATYLETDGQIKKPEFFVDEESIEEHTPKVLLSKRKIMSPTSQEKLCSALTGIDLCDGVQRFKSKIIIEDHDKTAISLPQPAHMQDRSMLSTDRRLKGRTSVSPTSEGVLKLTGSPPHQQTTCSCMRSSPVVLDTEKAVEFSQRQMHDIENIAAKLIRSLKHMKSIVDESLSTEAYSLLPNFNIAQIRAASEDALEVERTTRKWLSIMNKDCSRFCKILSLAKKNAVSHPEAPRKQRKITFADEAGGMLCHVKVFKDGQASLLSECQSDL